MEGPRKTATGQSTGPGRYSRARVVPVHFLHDRAQGCPAGPPIRAGRSTSARLTWPDLHPDPGHVGVLGLPLVRLLRRLLGRVLRRRWVVRRWWRIGELVMR